MYCSIQEAWGHDILPKKQIVKETFQQQPTEIEKPSYSSCDTVIQHIHACPHCQMKIQKPSSEDNEFITIFLYGLMFMLFLHVYNGSI